MIGLGSVALLGLLFMPGWMIVRRRLLSMSSPKLSPSGAVPWSRTRISDQVSAMTDRINAMQAGLSAKLQAADTQLAALQTQQQILTSSIQSLTFSSFGYQNNNTSTFSPSGG